MRPYLLLFAALWLTGCADDRPPDNDGIDPEEVLARHQANVIEGISLEELEELSPPPRECDFLSKEEVMAAFGDGTTIPLPGYTSVEANNTCEYGVDGPSWRARVVLERPLIPEALDSLQVRATEEGTPVEATVGNHPTYFLDGGSTLVVLGPQPFRVSLRTTASPDSEQPFPAARQREILLALGRAALD